jgi:nephrocystin-3
MQQERDYLIKFAFPQLRKLCEERGVIWSEVDLRWGITDEQSAEDQVLPICLQEIDNCRSFFIGILGERYGWIPEKIDGSLLERKQWIKELDGASVTEMEICYGALNNPHLADYAFFYIRDPRYVEAMPVEKQHDYSEFPSNADIQKFGMEQAQQKANQRKEQLTQLKNRIRKSGLHIKEDFNSPQQLGEWVLRDLTAIIDSLYPEGSQPTALQQEIHEHEMYAVSRARVYIGGEKYFQRIEEHIFNHRTPLVLIGESGIGKSALLANWGLQYKEKNAKTKVLMHFCGASTLSGDWAFMLRRIMGELKEYIDFEGDMPEDQNELRKAFPDWLQRASQKQKIVLILDALNQLEDKEGAQELTWLPRSLPENVGMIISTLPGKTLDEVTERGYEFLKVDPLNRQERELLVRSFLAQYSKQLNSQQLQTIIDNQKSSNPLAMRIMLDELRQFGIYEELDEIIHQYLNTDSITEMLKLVFKRYEKDYQVEHPALVKETLCSIWSARQGLSEAELLGLLGDNGLPLAQAIWSPLHLALGESINDRSGLLNFSHQYFRQAVEEYYLTNEDEKQAFHNKLAIYYQNLEGYPKRKVVELPWQWKHSQEWQALHDLLVDPDYFLAQWLTNQNDLYVYWAAVEENSRFHRAEAYIPVLEGLKNPFHPSIHDHQISYLNGISLLLINSGYSEKAVEFLKEQERICRLLGKKNDLQAALGNQGLVLRALGRLEEAMRVFKAQEIAFIEMDNRYGLQKSLGNQALILQAWGKYDEAMQLHKEKENICRELKNDEGVQIALGNQAIILKAKGKLEDAMHLYKEQERMCRELGNQDALQTNLGNQGLILNIWRKTDEAMRMQKEKERICRELGDLDGIQTALGNQAVILQGQRKFEECMLLLQEKEQICMRIKNAEGLCTSWVYLGSVQLMSGQKDSGLDFLHRAFDLANQNKFIAMASKIKIMLDKFS